MDGCSPCDARDARDERVVSFLLATDRKQAMANNQNPNMPTGFRNIEYEISQQDRDALLTVNLLNNNAQIVAQSGTMVSMEDGVKIKELKSSWKKLFVSRDVPQLTYEGIGKVRFAPAVG